MRPYWKGAPVSEHGVGITPLGSGKYRGHGAMVGGAARAALIAALLALATVCVSGARGKVTLTSASAAPSGAGVAIDLITSGPASFKLDRFTMGDWVYVWSPDLYSPAEE